MINDRKLLRLIDSESKNQSEAAKELGVSRQAVSKRLQELRGRQTRAIATAKIEKSIDAGFDAMQQLMNINTKALELLDQAEGDPELFLKCIGEVRQQIKLASDIYERMFNIQAIHDFMGVVADTLREVDPHVYKDFKKRINKHRSVRSAIRFT
jgi:predicted transcriptional regulator